MKKKLYIETSVVSYLTARVSSNKILAGHQVATQNFWAIVYDLFELYISELVLQEISRGDNSMALTRQNAVSGIPLLDVDHEVERVAGILIANKAVPEKYPEDAVHIAVAAVNKIELIATWNFKHINNPVMKGKMREALAEAGYALPEICSPDELLEVEDE